MRAHYNLKELKMLRDGHFKGFRQIAHAVYLESRGTGVQWIILTHREWGEGISIFYRWKSEKAYSRFSGFDGYKTVEEALEAMKDFDVKGAVIPKA